MPVDIKENEFYVCLLSNNSIQIYPENTLSAYTNILKYPLKLTNDWVVGLTEISFNSYNVTTKIQDRFKRKVDNFDGSYEPITKKTKSIRDVSKSTVSIKLSDQVKTTWAKQTLYHMADDKFVINFIDLLQAIRKSFSASWHVVYLKEIMKKMTDRLKQAKEKNDMKYVQYKQKEGLFLIKINLQNTQYVVLNYKDYASVEEFVEDIFGQIKPESRDYDRLICLIDPNTDSCHVDKEEEKNFKFYIDLRDIGATVKINKPLPSKMSVGDLCAILLHNLQWDDSSLEEYEKNVKISSLYPEVIKIFKNLKTDSMDAPVFGPVVDATTILNIPYEKTGAGTYRTTPVPIENKFDDLQSFLTHLFLQTPVEKRKPEVVGQAFAEGIQKAVEEQKQKDNTPKVDAVKEELNKILDLINTKIQSISAPTVTCPEISLERFEQKIHALFQSDLTKSSLLINTVNNFKKDVEEILQSLKSLTTKVQLSSVQNTLALKLVQLQNSVEEINNRIKRTPLPAEQQNISSDFNILYVYTDIIKPKIIGNMHTRYLKVLPVLTNSNQIIRFRHVEYCPIEKTFIESISIKITDAQGELLNFKPSYVPTYVMLHFKKP